MSHRLSRLVHFSVPSGVQLYVVGLTLNLCWNGTASASMSPSFPVWNTANELSRAVTAIHPCKGTKLSSHIACTVTRSQKKNTKEICLLHNKWLKSRADFHPSGFMKIQASKSRFVKASLLKVSELPDCHEYITADIVIVKVSRKLSWR